MQEGGPGDGFAVLDEVTGHTLAEEALGASEGRCQILFDVVPQPMLVYRLDTLRFIAVNNAAVRHYGYSRREFLAMTINDLCLPDDARRSRAEPSSSDPAGPRGLPTTCRHRQKDGTPIDVTLSGVSLIFNGRLARVIAVNDITERKRTEEALRESEEKWRSLVENAPNFIFTIDREGRILFFNRTPPGIDHRAVIGSSVYDYIVPRFRESVRATFERAFRTGKPDSYEVLGAGPHGTNAWYQSNVSALTREGRVVALLVIATDITERKRAEEDLRQLSSRLLRSQDEERRGIARELHDATSQTLAALAINLGVVNESAEGLRPEAREALGDSFRLLETCTREIRTMSYLLHPPMLEELSLPGALHWYTRGFTERSGTQVDLQMPPDLGDVPGDVALTIYRIVQESLANVYRHSGSRSATIRLSREPGEIVLTVADRGRGIPPGVLQRNLGKQRSESSPGVGITGMRERVRQLGGRLEIRSGIRGTTVTAVLPLGQEGARSARSSG